MLLARVTPPFALQLNLVRALEFGLAQFLVRHAPRNGRPASAHRTGEHPMSRRSSRAMSQTSMCDVENEHRDKRHGTLGSRESAVKHLRGGRAVWLSGERVDARLRLKPGSVITKLGDDFLMNPARRSIRPQDLLIAVLRGVLRNRLGL